MSPRPDRGSNAAVSLAACVLLLASVSGCASSSEESEAPSRASDPSDGAAEGAEGAEGTMVVGDTVEAGQARIVSVSNVEEQASPLAKALVDDRAVDAFLDGMDARLAAEVRTAVQDAQAPAGSTLFGSVVAVGCETPTEVAWETTFDGVQATAELPKSSVQCLVPVTSVALFLVEDAV